MATLLGPNCARPDDGICDERKGRDRGGVGIGFEKREPRLRLSFDELADLQPKELLLQGARQDEGGESRLLSWWQDVASPGERQTRPTRLHLLSEKGFAEEDTLGNVTGHDVHVADHRCCSPDPATDNGDQLITVEETADDHWLRAAGHHLQRPPLGGPSLGTGSNPGVGDRGGAPRSLAGPGGSSKVLKRPASGSCSPNSELPPRCHPQLLTKVHHFVSQVTSLPLKREGCKASNPNKSRTAHCQQPKPHHHPHATMASEPAASLPVQHPALPGATTISSIYTDMSAYSSDTESDSGRSSVSSTHSDASTALTVPSPTVPHESGPLHTTVLADLKPYPAGSLPFTSTQSDREEAREVPKAAHKRGQLASPRRSCLAADDEAHAGGHVAPRAGGHHDGRRHHHHHPPRNAGFSSTPGYSAFHHNENDSDSDSEFSHDAGASPSLKKRTLSPAKARVKSWMRYNALTSSKDVILADHSLQQQQQQLVPVNRVSVEPKSRPETAEIDACLLPKPALPKSPTLKPCQSATMSLQRRSSSISSRQHGLERGDAAGVYAPTTPRTFHAPARPSALKHEVLPDIPSRKLQQVGEARIRIELLSLFAEHALRPATDVQEEHATGCCGDDSSEYDSDSDSDSDSDDSDADDADSNMTVGGNPAIRQHAANNTNAGNSPQGGRTPADSSDVTSTQASRRGSAAPRGGGGGGGGDDNDNNGGGDRRKRKRKRSGAPDGPDGGQGSAPRLACPYQAYEPLQDCFRRGPRNPKGGCDGIYRLRQHFNRRHKLSHRCRRCWKAFENKVDAAQHESEAYCDPKPRSVNERFMLPEAEAEVDRSYGALSEEEVWWEMFRTLIPGMKDVSSSWTKAHFSPYYTVPEPAFMIPAINFTDVNFHQHAMPPSMTSPALLSATSRYTNSSVFDDSSAPSSAISPSMEGLLLTSPQTSIGTSMPEDSPLVPVSPAGSHTLMSNAPGGVGSQGGPGHAATPGAPGGGYMDFLSSQPLSVPVYQAMPIHDSHHHHHHHPDAQHPQHQHHPSDSMLEAASHASTTSGGYGTPPMAGPWTGSPTGDQAQLMHRNYERQRQRSAQIEADNADLRIASRDNRADLDVVDNMLADILGSEGLPPQAYVRLSQMSDVLMKVRGRLR